MIKVLREIGSCAPRIITSYNGLTPKTLAAIIRVVLFCRHPTVISNYTHDAKYEIKTTGNHRMNVSLDLNKFRAARVEVGNG